MATQQARGRWLAPAAILGIAAVMGSAVATAALLRESRSATDEQAVLRAPSPGRSLMLATATADVALFVTAQPGGPVELTALEGQGGLARDTLRVTAGGRSTELEPCGNDCIRFAAPVLQGSPTRIAVTVARPGKATSDGVVILPARLPPSGDAVLARAKHVMKGLRSVRYRESLTAGLGPTVVGHFQAQAPDRLRIDSNFGDHIVLIGDRRWISTNGRWTKSAALGTRQPAYPWDEARGARVLGRPRVAGGRGWLLAVRYPGREPVWFRLRVAPDGRVQDMVMVARAHFMTQRYSGFNRPVSIKPPVP